MVPGTRRARATVADSTAASEKGSGCVWPASHSGAWSFQCGLAGFPLLPAGSTPTLSVEIGQVVDGPPRRDHRRRIPVAGVHTRLQHGLVVAAYTGLERHEQRLEPRDRGQRMRESDPVQIAPAPTGSVLAEHRPELGDGGVERLGEQLRVELAGAEHAGERTALERLTPRVVSG